MPIVVNPYSDNPDLSSITSNLAKAIFGDPETRMKRDYYSSEVLKNSASARKTGLEADRLQTGNQQFNDLPDIQAQLAPMPGESPIQYTIRTAPLRGRLMQAYPSSNIQQAVDGGNSQLAGIFALGDPDAKRTSLVMQGKMPDQNFAGTATESDRIEARNAGEDRRTKFGVANIEQSGANARNAATIQGENTRFFNTPLKANAGETVYLAPTDPRYKSMGAKVTGAPNKATVEGQAGTRILNGDNSDVNQGLYTGKMGPGSANGKPRAVAGKNVNDAVLEAARSIPGAVDATNAAKPILSPDFEASFNDPALVASARNAAAQELAASGNVAKAGQAYLTTLGVKAGDTFGKQGGVFGIGGHYAITPAAGSVTPHPAQAPVVEHPAQLPPPAARKNGMTINTPRGLATWDAATQSWKLGGA